MQKTVLLFVSLFVCSLVFAQNKKQQIEVLTLRIDSISAVLQAERAVSDLKITELTTTVDSLNKRLADLNKELAAAKQQQLVTTQQLSAATTRNAEFEKVLALKNDTIKQLKAPPSLKRKTLTSLVGTHPLMAISASAGANTLLDFYKENGKWTADGSSLHQAQREGFDIELIQDDYDKLASYTITVQADLTVVIACKNKHYFTIPFNDNGIFFDLNTANDYLMLPPNLSETTTFQADKLFLFATDKITEAVSSELTVNEMFIGNAAYLFYDNKEKTFELFFFNGDPTSFVFR
jgi:hypothetical protein